MHARSFNKKKTKYSSREYEIALKSTYRILSDNRTPLAKITHLISNKRTPLTSGSIKLKLNSQLN